MFFNPVLDPTKDEPQIAAEFQQIASRIVFHAEYKDEQIDSQFTLDARGFETAYSSIGHREKINEVKIEGEYNALQGPKKIKMSRGSLTPDGIFWDILSPSLKNFQSDNDVPLEISFQILAHEVNPSELIHFIESDGLSDTTAFDDIQTSLSLKIGEDDLVFLSGNTTVEWLEDGDTSCCQYCEDYGMVAACQIPAAYLIEPDSGGDVLVDFDSNSDDKKMIYRAGVEVLAGESLPL